ncbi:MAG: SGNH/GDSL hydrolase family protein, partial [Planctomycetes bacterium]|nr:SGNH/GDSL hydrolase family protein [Planctomycetota bacterium]
LEAYDAVVLGDSFAEGSRVTDGDCWPDKLSQASGLSVYNLGMSGYAPQHYLASLVEVGLALHPKTVFCLLYEGNDVRSAKVTSKPESRKDRLFKSSPLRQKLDDLILGAFAPIGAKRQLKELEMLSWLPLSVSAEGSGPHYAFAPKQLLSLCVDPESLVNGKRWKATTEILRDMNARCVAAGAELVLVYAPTKAHVVLPLVADRLPAEKVHAFAALRAKDSLPPPQQFLESLPDRMDAYETVAQQWCEEEGIEFISLTPPLRQAAAAGRQIYYTYDQHWTPVGHEVVAQVVARYCINRANDSGA